MIIIGHRGAAGMEPENTLASIEAAVNVGVDRIEIDVQTTKDGKLVLFHDSNLLRLAGVNKNISDMTLKDLNLTVTHSGHPIPTINEAFEAAGNVPLLLDCKGKGWAELTHEALKGYKGPRPMVTAVNVQEMFRFKVLRPDVETYVSEITHPFEGIYKAKTFGFTGISLNFWVLTPLAYWYAKRNNLKFMIFTVNSVFYAKYLHRLYPNAAIITNVPHRLAPLAQKRKTLKRQTGKAKG